MRWKGCGLFAAGVAFGTAGVRLLTSRDAKRLYAHCTAAVLRMKDAVMDQAATIQENCSDIYAEAKCINENLEGQEDELDDGGEN